MKRSIPITSEAKRILKSHIDTNCGSRITNVFGTSLELLVNIYTFEELFKLLLNERYQVRESIIKGAQDELVENFYIKMYDHYGYIPKAYQFENMSSYSIWSTNYFHPLAARIDYVKDLERLCYYKITNKRVYRYLIDICKKKKLHERKTFGKHLISWACELEDYDIIKNNVEYIDDYDLIDMFTSNKYKTFIRYGITFLDESGIKQLKSRVTKNKLKGRKRKVVYEKLARLENLNEAIEKYNL